MSGGFSRRTSRNFVTHRGLLPTPLMAWENDPSSSSSFTVRLSAKEYEKLIESPYLAFFKRKLEQSMTLATKDDFDKEELADCLPGLPGVRQSKEYKKIRRKIKEIDHLRARPAESLDAFQLAKIKKREQLVQQIRFILHHGVESMKSQEPDSIVEEQEDEISKEEPSIIEFSEVKKHTRIDEVLEKKVLEIVKRRRIGRKQKKRSRQVQEIKKDQLFEPHSLNFEETAVAVSQDTKRKHPQILESFFSEFMQLCVFIITWWGSIWAAFFIGHHHEPPLPRIGRY